MEDGTKVTRRLCACNPSVCNRNLIQFKDAGGLAEVGKEGKPERAYWRPPAPRLPLALEKYTGKLSHSDKICKVGAIWRSSAIRRFGISASKSQRLPSVVPPFAANTSSIFTANQSQSNLPGRLS